MVMENTKSNGALYVGEGEQKKLDWFWLCAILLIGFLVRLHFLWITSAGIESDEAIVGLMAKHMSEGRAWPIFYYGQNYLGSFEAILTSFVFRLIGVSNFSLKCVPFIFSLFHIIAVYELACLLFGKHAARVTALCVAVPPSALLIWSLKARGGFIELVVIGTLSLIVSVKLLNARYECLSLSKLCGLGFILGFGWWINNQIIYYMASIGVVFFFYFLFSKRVIKGAIYLRFIKILQVGSLGAVGFFLGGAPFWYANLFNKPRFTTFLELGKSAKSSDVFNYLEGFWVEALPILLGARRLWNEQDVFYGASAIVFAIYALCIVVAIIACCSAYRSHGNSKSNVSVASIVLIGLFCLFIQIIFSISGFGWLSKEPRYLLPIYSVQFLLIGIAVAWIWHVKSLSWMRFVLSNLVIAALLSVHLLSSYYKGLAIPGEPFIGSEGDRVQRDHKALYAWLNNNNYQHIVTNYWVGYRVAFETNERVTFTRFRQPRSLRVPEYEQVGLEYLENPVYVLGAKEAEMVSRVFRDSGFIFRATEVSGYIIFDNLRPIVPRGEQIDLSMATLYASSRASWLKNLVDDNINTRWGSGMPQSPNMFIEVELPVNTVISGIDIDMGLWPQDVAAKLLIEAISDSGSRCVLFDRVPDLELVRDGRTVEINFPVMRTQKIKIFQTANRAVFDWSIAEIRVYAPSKN